MYDGVATLIKYGESTYDDYGNEEITPELTEVFVQPRGVYQSEYYNAAQNGLKPSLTLFIANKEDYDGQKVVVYEGREYSVIRVDWSAQRDGISLICEERANG
jgi:SPP1 family predicted phage head-tail adaptor